MTKEQKVQAHSMRLDGATYQEIADAMGVSKQYIYELLNKKAYLDCHLSTYPGLNEWLEDHNIFFTKMWINAGLPNARRTSAVKSGKVQLKIHEIKAILAYTGLTFEKAFGKGEHHDID